MDKKKRICGLNLFSKCKEYNVSIWKCPQFLFTLMGVMIMITTIFSYLLGVKYMVDPEIATIFILATTSTLFVIAFVITRSFEDLAESSKLKSEFVTIISHQLRTPISNLRWGVDAFKQDKEKSIGSKEEYIQVLIENIERMNNIVSDLLIVSKIQQKRLALIKEEVDINDLAKKAVEGVKFFAKANNIEINFNGSATLPKILTDSHLIRMVLDNLIDNSIKYIQERGSVEVEVGKGKREIFFRVKDNGVGIPKEDQKNIFDKFFRSKNALKFQTSGTGLGLYISKAIITEAGGKIDFKSREGEGTTFWFSLPF